MKLNGNTSKRSAAAKREAADFAAHNLLGKFIIFPSFRNLLTDFSN